MSMGVSGLGARPQVVSGASKAASAKPPKGDMGIIGSAVAVAKMAASPKATLASTLSFLNAALDKKAPEAASSKGNSINFFA